MADITIKQHDTYPPLRGAAYDADGLLDLSGASSARVVIKGSGTAVLGGTVSILDPAVNGYNWSYSWRSVDTAGTGTFSVELEITWDANSSPARVETLPADGFKTLEIKGDLA